MKRTELLTGTVTFLFTDIEGSTRLPLARLTVTSTRLASRSERKRFVEKETATGYPLARITSSDRRRNSTAHGTSSLEVACRPANNGGRSRGSGSLSPRASGAGQLWEAEAPGPGLQTIIVTA